ncbi:MAG: hypothetical protein MJ146_02145 [Clostridia bacterium]|nr:hypothetical protein [Clostridia bacterium]
MKKETNALLKEVSKYSLILLVVGLLISLLITKTSIDILIIYIVGWVTALLNLFLLAYFIIMLRSGRSVLQIIPVFAIRYVIYGFSMFKCIHSLDQGIYWSAGVITIAIALMIGGITSQKERRKNNEC